MKDFLIKSYVILFARARFEKFNNFLYRLALGGLGVLNYRDSNISGENHFLTKCLRSTGTGVVIDVGANRGDYTKLVSSLNPSARIYAFEPHPKTYQSLMVNVGGAKNVTAINKGLSETQGVLDLYDYENQDGSSHATLFKDVLIRLHGSSKVVAHQVQLLSLDDFVKQENIDEISLLKIDTEGNELSVLRGALDTIKAKKIKLVHIEFNEMNVISKVFFKDFWDLLQDYRLYRLLPHDMLLIKKYCPIECELFAYQNIVAILKD